MKTLALTTAKHPRPYKVSRIKKGLELKVTEVCRVPLSIGKSYSDEISCEVLDMDACHIILGRPWQFDRGMTHKGRENTYFLTWNGHKIALLPLVPATLGSPPPPNPDKNLFLTASTIEFTSAVKESKMLVAMLVKETESRDLPLPPAIQHFLVGFPDVVVPDDLPADYLPCATFSIK